MLIVSRTEWGATPWVTQPDVVGLASRRDWFLHYHGGPVAASADRGVRMAREVERIHLGHGWAGVGYSFMVGQDGVAYEGRGWGRQCAACPGHNISGLHCYVAVGGDQRPTGRALATVRALYDEACHRTGRALAKTWHGAHWPTDCAGPVLIPWVRAGMPAPSTPAPTHLEDDVQLSELAGWNLGPQIGVPEEVNFQTLLARVYRATVLERASQIDYGRLADALALRGVSVDPHAVARAVLDQLAADVADRPGQQ